MFPSDGTNPQQGAENRQPLPNPWQRGGGGGGGGAAGTGGTGAAPTGPGLINTPGMQSLLQQMSENPRLVQSMLSAPYTNTMLQALAADPDMASQLINQVCETRANLLLCTIEQIVHKDGDKLVINEMMISFTKYFVCDKNYMLYLSLCCNKLIKTYILTEPDVREQPPATGTDPYNDAANVSTVTESRDAADDVQPTGQYFQ